MKQTILLTLVCASLLTAGDTFTGVITDTMCGKSHHMMAGQSDEKCIAACVKGSSQYALFDGTNVYRLSDQKMPARFAARRVKVTGTLNPGTKTIKVSTIESEPAGN